MDNLLLDYKQMAKLFQVNESTIRTWVNRKQIPEDTIFKMPGKKGTIRFVRTKIENWICKQGIA